MTIILIAILIMQFITCVCLIATLGGLMRIVKLIYPICSLENLKRTGRNL